MSAPERAHRGDVDGLRALAVLGVLAFHAAPHLVPGGFLGVDVFFVVSGYLVTQQRIAPDAPPVVSFWARRVRRLVPALLVVLVATLGGGAALLTAGELVGLGRATVAGATFVSNLLGVIESGYFAPSATQRPLLHLWSLGVEEQLYLVWPLLLAALPARRGLATAALAAGSLALALAVAPTHPAAAFHLLPFRLWEPLLGALVALHVDGRAGGWAAGLGVALLAGSFATVHGTDVHPGLVTLAPTLGATLVLAAPPDTWAARGLAIAPLRAVGRWSYALYLWHWPLLVFAARLSPDPRVHTLALALAFPIAAASTSWVEAPFRAGRGSVPGLLAALVAVAGLGAVAAAGLVPAGDAAIERRLRASAAEDERLDHAYDFDSCRGPNTPQRITDMCRVSSGDAQQPTLVVWGDSHALAWAPGMFALAARTGERVAVIAHGGCPPLVGVHNVDGPRGRSEACVEPGLGDDVLAAIRDLHPTRVVLVARWSMYAEGWTQSGAAMAETHFIARDGQPAGGRDESRRALAEQLPATLDALRALTDDVSVLRTLPQLRGPLAAALADETADTVPTLAEHRAYEGWVDGVLDRLGTPTRDPALRTCQGERCAVALDGLLLYRDDSHVSAAGAVLLADLFAP